MDKGTVGLVELLAGIVLSIGHQTNFFVHSIDSNHRVGHLGDLGGEHRWKPVKIASLCSWTSMCCFISLRLTRSHPPPLKKKNSQPTPLSPPHSPIHLIQIIWCPCGDSLHKEFLSSSTAQGHSNLVQNGLQGERLVAWVDLPKFRRETPNAELRS